MKKAFVTFCLGIICVLGQAQNDSSYFEVGVNVIRIANFGFGNGAMNNDVWNPYMLTAAGHYKRLGLRVGMGYRNAYKTELPTAANGMNKVNTDSTKADMRIGLEWEVALKEKWSFKFGVDYFTSNQMSELKNSFTNESNQNVITTHTLKMNEKGVSPFAYIQYHITKRVSLGTELLWRISSYTASDIETNNLSSADITRKYEGTKRWIMSPTALFLNVRF